MKRFFALGFFVLAMFSLAAQEFSYTRTSFKFLHKTASQIERFEELSKKSIKVDDNLDLNEKIRVVGFDSNYVVIEEMEISFCDNILISDDVETLFVITDNDVVYQIL